MSTFEDTVVIAIAEVDKDIKELRKKVLELESTVAAIETKCEALQPFKPPVIKGPWAQKWGIK